ncbi:MAG: prephenate dehydrogenase [Flavobacteriales bacterium]|nr:prephenate dehydrogenase [Bacteroidales bacterium AH-315-I05]PCJ88103.1 MAG: prephenate dehydrogenase [Flavobacteriales bacterium]
MEVTIIGLGLIGGSLAMALRQNGFATHIIGVENNEEHGEQALELGLADEVLPLDEAISKGEMIIIAISVDAARKLLPEILDQINESQTVMDMGSTKAGICSVVENHPNRKNYVAAHPIAGTENTGPKAAINNLFFHKVAIICEKEKSGEQQLALAEQLFRSLFMKLVYMAAKEHDLHAAYVSHLSHISSFTLGLTVLDIEKDEQNIFNLAGSGFASTVRLAKSSPEMWAPIFEQNAEYLSDALDTYIKWLTKFKKLIDSKQKNEVEELMRQANDVGRILDGIELGEK